MRSIRLLLLLVVTQGFLVAQDVLIKDARVFDGQRVIPRASVLVRDGKIEKIGTHIRVPRNVHIVDGREKTLIPGLIDAHTHIRSRRDLEQSAVFGVTTDISMLMDLQLAKAQKAEQNAKKASDRADLFSSGYVATAPGGHGTEYGLKFPTLTRPEGAQAWVDDRIAEGSDFIKIIYEFGGDTGHGGRPSIDRATMDALVAAAHARGKLAVVHIHSEQQAMDAIDSGAGTALTFVGLPGLKPLPWWQTVAVFVYAMVACLGFNDAVKVAMIKWRVPDAGAKKPVDVPPHHLTASASPV